MGYEYTASDHIGKPLHYHYTAYQGTAFMQDWYNERKKAMMQIGEADQELQFPDAGGSSLMDWEEKQERTGVINTNEIFSILLYELRNGKNISGPLKRQFDGFVKTFEVRKRLYPQYSLRFKPMDETAYWNVALYADFAYICATALTCYQDLRYLNVLLKVNDTLVSQLNCSPTLLGQSDQKKLSYALKREVDFVTEVCQKKGIEWGQRNGDT